MNPEKKGKRPLKVALVHPKYRPDGGSERLLEDIIEVLLQNQVEILLITRKALHIPDDHLVFIFVGSGFERKGLAVLIDAFAEMPDDCELLVIGKDKNLKKISKNHSQTKYR
ncbi:MAG: glycosyltransferase [Desulfobacterales bacterium]